MSANEHEPERQFEPGERERLEANLAMGASVLRHLERRHRMKDLHRILADGPGSIVLAPADDSVTPSKRGTS